MPSIAQDVDDYIILGHPNKLRSRSSMKHHAYTQGRSQDLRIGSAMKKRELTFMSRDFSYVL
jgi:hypothetical protein